MQLTRILLALVLAFQMTAVQGDVHTESDDPVRSAMAVLDEFMKTFNARDLHGWAATLNYPHVRFASGNVAVYDGPEAFTDRPVFEMLARTGWDHSHWISREVVLKSAGKVHIATVFQRFNGSNEPVGTYESLYIVTRQDGQWGIQARSSLAP